MYTIHSQPPLRRLSTQSIYSIHSTSSSTSSSPQTSPPGTSHGLHNSHLPVPCRQLHPPKSPLYRPAVLRPLSRPLSPTSDEVFFKSEYSVSSEAPDTVDLSSEPEEDTAPTGPPSREHWKPDSLASICDAPACTRNFGLVVRRHHCRRCGNVFCHSHAARFLPLSQTGRVHPQGQSSRVCDGCWEDIARVRAARRSGSVSSASSLSGSPPSAVMMRPRAVEALKESAKGSYVGSVPRDWSWSTF
jgi:hypothetical protein